MDGAVTRSTTRPAMSCDAPGFTVIELLISMTLLLLAFALAGQLLLETRRTVALAGRELADPLTVHAITRLRHDIRGSRSTQPAPGLFPIASEGPLTLLGHPAGTVRYRRRGNELVREVLDGEGELVTRHTLLWQLSGWRWRPLSAGRVQVHLAFAVTPLDADDAFRHRLPPPSTAVDTVTLTLGLRGRERLGRW